MNKKFEESVNFTLTTNIKPYHIYLHIDNRENDKIFITFDYRNGNSITLYKAYDYDKNKLMDTYVRYLSSLSNAIEVLNLNEFDFSGSTNLITGVMLFILEFLVNEMKRS